MFIYWTFVLSASQTHWLSYYFHQDFASMLPQSVRIRVAKQGPDQFPNAFALSTVQRPSPLPT